MSDRPNVLLVLTDQYRAQALGCMGNAQADTPNLDRIVAEGLPFENAYSPNPVCSPARESIRTGCYSHRHRVIGNTYKQIPLPTDFDMLGECSLRRSSRRSDVRGTSTGAGSTAGTII